MFKSCLCNKNYKNIKLHDENCFITQKSESINYENPLKENSPSEMNSVVSFELNDDKFGIHDDDSDITLENWLSSNSSEYDSDSCSTMSLFSDDVSSLDSSSDCSSLSDLSEIEEMYSDYDTYGSDDSDSEDSETYVENRFYSNDDASDQTMPAEYMSKENQKKIIPMVIGHAEKTVETKRGRKSKIKVKLFKILLDSGATSNLIADYLVPRTNKTEKSAVTFTTANGKFATKSCTDVTFTLPEFSSSKEVNLNFNVFKNDKGIPYDMIIGT